MPTPREFAVDVIRTLRDAGHEALLAGGCVRDELLGVEPKDYDIATAALPEQVQQLFRRTVAVGASFGVIEVLGPHRLCVQVATFRSDGDYSNGRGPDSVEFCCSAEEDAPRRDFTINGMFFDPLDERLIDYVGGQADLEAGLLRAIGDAAARFREDRLRMLRAVRMAARFELEIDPATGAAIMAMAGQLDDGVSAERIADELRKMLVDPHRARAMRLFVEYGFDRIVFSGPVRMHPEVTDRLGEKPSFPLAFAALIYAEGRPRAEEFALRLKLSTEERERVEWLIENHRTLTDARSMRPSQLKPLLVHPGIDDLMALHRAIGHDPEALDFAIAIRHQWDEAGELNPPPLITGNDLLALGLPQGPMYKTLLRRVRDAQLDSELIGHEQAIALVQRILAGQT